MGAMKLFKIDQCKVFFFYSEQGRGRQTKNDENCSERSESNRRYFLSSSSYPMYISLARE
jgi:hypothetical protein